MISRHLKNLALIFADLLLAVSILSCGEKKTDGKVTITRPSLTSKPVKTTERVIPRPEETPPVDYKDVPSPEQEKKVARMPATGERRKAAARKMTLPTEEDEGLTRCFSLSGNARTNEEALFCAQAHMQRSLDLMSSNMDSAFIYCKRAITLYENGSLFTIKARILFAMGRFSEACQAAECSIARHDHWDVTDRITAGKVRLDAYKALYDKYPSTAALENVNKAKADFAILRTEGQ